MIYGFVGTGTITEAMVHGLLSSSFPVEQIFLSPRNADTAARLAAQYDKVTVAASNQAVVEASDTVILAVRPQIAEVVLRDITIPDRCRLISVIAATSHEKLAEWTGHDASRIVRAIPLPFVGEREGVTAVYPRDAQAEAFFDAMGSSVGCETKHEFDLLAAASSTMGTYFGILGHLTDWLVRNGMEEAKVQSYLLPLFHSLGAAARRTPDKGFADLRDEFSTRGGLNEQVARAYDAAGGGAALQDALDGVLKRITA